MCHEKKGCCTKSAGAPNYPWSDWHSSALNVLPKLCHFFYVKNSIKSKVIMLQIELCNLKNIVGPAILEFRICGEEMIVGFMTSCGMGI